MEIPQSSHILEAGGCLGFRGHSAIHAAAFVAEVVPELLQSQEAGPNSDCGGHHVIVIGIKSHQVIVTIPDLHGQNMPELASF